MKIEQLKPAQSVAELEQRLKDLKAILQNLKKKNVNLPQGHLKVATKQKRKEFYHIKEPGCSRGIYIPKAQVSLAAQLAQKDYNLRLAGLVEKEIGAIERFLKSTLKLTEISHLYEGLCPGRQALITPITLTNAQYAAEWKKVSWQGKVFFDDAPNYFTSNNERMRSKSEVIIAETLQRYRVPYRYEYPLNLKRAAEAEQVTIYPDFLCLNVRTREEFFWEHFGMMDDPEYVQRTISKLSLYIQNGIFPGRGLIISMESGTEYLDTKDLERLIKNYLI